MVDPLGESQVALVPGNRVNVCQHLHDAPVLGLEHLSDLRVGELLEHGAQPVRHADQDIPGFPVSEE